MYKNIFVLIKLFHWFVGYKLLSIPVFSLLASIIEVVSLTLLIPVLQAVVVGSSIVKLSDNKISVVFLQSLGLENNLSTQTLLYTLLSCILLKAILIYWSFSNAANLIESSNIQVKRLLLNGMTSLKYIEFLDLNYPKFVNIYSEQCSVINLAFNNLVLCVSKTISTIIYLISALIISWQITLLTLILMAPCLLIFKLTSAKVSYLSRKQVKASSKIQELLTGLGKAYKYLKSINQLNNYSSRILSLSDNNEMLIKKSYQYRSLSTAAREPIIIFILLFSLFVSRSAISAVGDYVALLLILHRLLTTAGNLQVNIQNLEAYLGPVEAVMDNVNFYRGRDENEKGSLPVHNFSQIIFKDLSFSVSNQCILDKLSFTLEKGNHYGLVGKSGSGKSTLIDILTLLYSPTSGKLLIDGYDSTQINKTLWRNKISFVPQNPYIYNDTIINNLYYGYNLLPHEQQTKVMNLAVEYSKRCDIYDFIVHLPLKFETLIGDCGSQLSGGQLQRLALTRELMKEPNLLILDEVTSALDPGSEKIINNVIDNISSNITIISVSHKISALENCYKIYVMEQGKIIDSLNFEELLKTKDKIYGIPPIVDEPTSA